MKRMACPTARFAHLSLHAIGGEAVLFDLARRRLYALNACAAFICDLLKAGQSPEEAGRSLSEQFALPTDTATSYVADFFKQYDGVLGDDRPSVAETAVPEAGPPFEGLRGRTSEAFRARPAKASVAWTYALLDCTFRVHYDSAALCEEIHPLLQNRTVADEGERTRLVELTVGTRNGGVVVIEGEEVIGSSRTVAEAAVTVRACLTQLAVVGSGGLCAIHAGALCRNGQALLLPGNAGYGKSTLSAGLAARGFEMLCDDTTLLAGEPPLARSIPTSLCVKRGAYAVLEPHYPRLPSLAEWRRADGQSARYLMAGTDVRWAVPDMAADVRWIVFPQYQPDRGTRLLPLQTTEALARLLGGAYMLSGSLDERNLARLIAWIEPIGCFELPLSSLDAAMDLLGELCT